MPNPKGNPSTLKPYAAQWRHGRTRTIRVPVALADKVLEYARQIDDQTLTQAHQVNNSKANKVITQDQDIKLRQTLTQVIAAIEKVCDTPHTSKFTRLMKAQLTAYAVEPLKALTQVNESVE